MNMSTVACLRPLRLGEEKKKKKETGQKYNVCMCYAGQPYKEKINGRQISTKIIPVQQCLAAA